MTTKTHRSTDVLTDDIIIEYDIAQFDEHKDEVIKTYQLYAPITITDLALVRRAKAMIGITNQRCFRSKINEVIELRLNAQTTYYITPCF